MIAPKDQFVARSHGWSVLAERALELAALAFVSRSMDAARTGRKPGFARTVQTPSSGVQPQEQPQTEAPVSHEAPAADPMTFLHEGGGPDTRYYRAADTRGEMLAAFYADGRVRLADATHRFAGVVDNGRADVLEISEKTWSELLVRTTPAGDLELEMRGGPYDGRILSCRLVPQSEGGLA